MDVGVRMDSGDHLKRVRTRKQEIPQVIITIIMEKRIDVVEEDVDVVINFAFCIVLRCQKILS